MHTFSYVDVYLHSYGYSVVMYGCENWTIKKAECWRTDALELWYWRRLLRVPWTARRSNQSILKEINPENSLEGLMPKLKLQYFGHLMQRIDSLETTLMLGKIEGKRRRGRQRMCWLDGIADSMAMSLSKLQETAKSREACVLVQSWTRPSDWATTHTHTHTHTHTVFFMFLSILVYCRMLTIVPCAIE